MLKKSNVFFLLAMLVCYSESQAQSLSANSDVLVWTYDRFLNGRTQETLVAAGKLITYPNNKITWEQDSEHFTEIYNVTGLQNSWADVTAAGEVQFNLTWNGNLGVAKFSKTGQGLLAELRIKISGKPDAFFKFYLVNVQKL